jgi:tetratricopeptide (TPR) repeat protein
MQLKNDNIEYSIRMMLLNLLLMVSVSSVTAADNISISDDFAGFNKSIEMNDSDLSNKLGDKIFGKMLEKYERDSGFVAYKSKLMLSEYLARQMISRLQKAAQKRMQEVAGDPLGDKDKHRDRSLAVSPAKNIYESSKAMFAKPVKIEGLSDDDKKFLGEYYNLKLRNFTSDIAKAGQGLAVAESQFKGTHNYVLVLPLLHIPSSKGVNVNLLPPKMTNSMHLKAISDSCLFHYGMPHQAMEVAREMAGNKKTFSEYDFYNQSSKKCTTEQVNIAVECLKMAIDCVPENEQQKSIELKFDIVQLWLDSKNYSLAAGQAKEIFETFSDIPEDGKAIWLYYYALSRSNNVDAILANVDSALSDERCKSYKAKLMYIKWWALRRKRDEGARVAVLEHELIKLYGDSPMIAPVFLSRATDLLAQQNYNDAKYVLADLIEKFPETKAAIQAKKMVEKLEKIGSSGDE